MADLNKSVDTNKVSGVVLLALLVIAGVLYWIYQDQITGSISPSTAQPLTPTTQVSTRNDLTIGKQSETTDDAGYRHIFVDVTNGGELKSAVLLSATLYDSNDTVIGTSIGSISNLGKGETKTSDILVTDSTAKTYTKYKVDLNNSY